MKNPLTMLDKINPDAPMKLKHFKESDFHEVCGMREEITTLQSAHPDEDSGHGFRKGDKVEFGVFNIGTFSEDKAKGIVRGIQGPFVRVGLELYHPQRLRKL